MHFHWLLIINASLPVPPPTGSCLFCCCGLWLGTPCRCRGAACPCTSSCDGQPELGKEVSPARLTLCPQAPGNSSSRYSFTVTSLGRNRTIKLRCRHCCQRQRGMAGDGKGHGQGPGTGGTSGVFGSVPAARV